MAQEAADERAPYKLTPELTVRVCKMLRSGICDVEQACMLEGISRASFYSWRKLGREGKEPYATFLHATEEAMLRVDLALNVTVLDEALGNKEKKRKPNWKAAAWMIRWRSTRGAQRVEVTGAGGAPLAGSVTHALTQESADAIRSKILFGDRKRPLPAEAESSEDEPEEEEEL